MAAIMASGFQLAIGAPICTKISRYRPSKQITSDLDCYYFDAGSVVTASTIDGVHIDSGQHLDLGKALTELVQSILTTQSNEG
jgi:hypothetical protein